MKSVAEEIWETRRLDFDKMKAWEIEVMRKAVLERLAVLQYNDADAEENETLEGRYQFLTRLAEMKHDEEEQALQTKFQAMMGDINFQS